jgi:hypothetical protein
VAGFPDLGLLRPAPTAARPPTPLPGFAGYRRGIASRHAADRRGRDGSPGFPGRPSARSTPNTPEGSSAPAPGPKTLSVAFAVNEPARLPLSRLTADLSDDACSGFTCVADRAIDPAPLRTRPHGHARGLHYRGPRRLPGPDSHRQAALNLSLLCHVVLLLLMAPEQSRRTRPTQQRTGAPRGSPGRLICQEAEVFVCVLGSSSVARAWWRGRGRPHSSDERETGGVSGEDRSLRRDGATAGGPTGQGPSVAAVVRPPR